MLIELKAENFRSIRDEQKLSLVASNYDDTLPDNIIDKPLPGLSSVRFLKGAAIYGANASGKSNVLLVGKFISEFVTSSATNLKPGDKTGTVPFKLDAQSPLQPSKFEVTFETGGIRYLYGFAATRQRVLEEHLVAYPKGQPQKWIGRSYNAESKAYDWERASANFKHDKALQERTRENSLFVSVGAQFNHPQLLPVFDWFKTGLRYLQLSGGEEVLGPAFTAEMLQHPATLEKIIQLMKSADFGIASAKVSKKEVPLDVFKKALSAEMLAKLEADGMLDQLKKQLDIQFLHNGRGIDPVPLGFGSESAGTRRFFSLTGPWLDTLQHGYTVFIDEIDTSLHPHLVRELLKLLLSKETNTNGAQIIFTTHNPVLLDTGVMRRDQIWFTEKTPEGSTHLYPLSEYSPRKDEALGKGYLAGRYGAIPFIPDGLKL